MGGSVWVMSNCTDCLTCKKVQSLLYNSYKKAYFFALMPVYTVTLATSSTTLSLLILCHFCHIFYYSATSTTMPLLLLCHFYYSATSTTLPLLLLCHFYYSATSTTLPLLLTLPSCCTAFSVYLLKLAIHLSFGECQ